MEYLNHPEEAATASDSTPPARISERDMVFSTQNLLESSQKSLPAALVVIKLHRFKSSQLIEDPSSQTVDALRLFGAGID